MKTLGKIMAVIGVLLAIVFAKGIGRVASKHAINNYNQTKLDAEIEKEILQTSKQINAQLPIMVDKETRADVTLCTGKHLVCKYTMVNLLARDINKDAFIRETKSKFIKNQSSNGNMIKLLKMGIEYDYMYQDRYGDLIATFNISKADLGL